jgi:hypothetical protein
MPYSCQADVLIEAAVSLEDLWKRRNNTQLLAYPSPVLMLTEEPGFHAQQCPMCLMTTGDEVGM